MLLFYLNKSRKKSKKKKRTNKKKVIKRKKKTLIVLAVVPAHKDTPLAYRYRGRVETEEKFILFIFYVIFLKENP